MGASQQLYPASSIFSFQRQGKSKPAALRCWRCTRAVSHSCARLRTMEPLSSLQLARRNWWCQHDIPGYILNRIFVNEIPVIYCCFADCLSWISIRGLDKSCALSAGGFSLLVSHSNTKTLGQLQGLSPLCHSHTVRAMLTDLAFYRTVDSKLGFPLFVPANKEAATSFSQEWSSRCTGNIQHPPARRCLFFSPCPTSAGCKICLPPHH